MFTSAAKRYAIDPAVESITCKISLIYLNDHLDVDMKVPSCNAKMEVFFQPKRRKKPIAFNPCFPLKIYPLVFVGIHYLVSMNNVRRITFGTLRKKRFSPFFFLLLLLLLDSISFIYFVQRAQHIPKFLDSTNHMFIWKSIFIWNSSEKSFLEVSKTSGNQPNLK